MTTKVSELRLQDGSLQKMPVYKIRGHAGEELRIKAPSEKAYVPHDVPGGYWDTNFRLENGGSTYKLSGVPEQLTVSFSGLAGDLSGYNGDNTIYFDLGSLGIYQSADTVLNMIYLDGGAGAPWTVTLIAAASDCNKVWARSDASPYGSYSEDSCDATGCSDGNTCTDSAGATCDVSLKQW